jgi:CheY-like chemotaxis protein
MRIDSFNPSVLVVEDEGLVALHLREILADLGLRAHVFMEGKPALEAIRSTTYSAAVLDLGLPDVAGDQIVSALLARDPKFRIVLATGKDKKEVERRYADASRVRVLSKPYDARMLEEELSMLGIVPKPRAAVRTFDHEIRGALMMA